MADIHTHVQPDHAIDYVQTLVEDEKIHKFINTDEIEITFEDNENNSQKKITIVMDKRLYRRIDRAALIETLKRFKPRGPTAAQQNAMKQDRKAEWYAKEIHDDVTSVHFANM